MYTPGTHVHTRHTESYEALRALWMPLLSASVSCCVGFTNPAAITSFRAVICAGGTR